MTTATPYATVTTTPLLRHHQHHQHHHDRHQIHHQHHHRRRRHQYLTPRHKSLSNHTSYPILGLVNVAEVDVTANRALGSRFEVKGFPTLLYFTKGTMYKYQVGTKSRNHETKKSRNREMVVFGHDVMI